MERGSLVQGRSGRVGLYQTVLCLMMLSWISYLLYPMGLFFPFHCSRCLVLVQIQDDCPPWRHINRLRGPSSPGIWRVAYRPVMAVEGCRASGEDGMDSVLPTAQELVPVSASQQPELDPG